ncbi:MAG: hypothetical protein VCA36_00690, partial [Opitutales bacterium]
MIRLPCTLLVFSLLGQLPAAAKVTDYYSIQKVAPPKLLLDRYGQNGVQTDGLDFMPDGRLVACFVGGEVFTLRPGTGKWKLFADGL